MILIIETPKSILNTLQTVHGANKISLTLLQLFSNSKHTTIIIVSNLSIKECKDYENHSGNKHKALYTNYTQLNKLLTLHNIVPDAGISFDIKLQALLSFRNLNNYKFPIIGLIHSLGFQDHFNSMLSAQSMMQPLINLFAHR